jgi:hypothetical protein
MISILQALLRRFKREKWASDAYDLTWLNPPDDPHDEEGWDRYWDEQLTHGLGPPLFDMFLDDRRLIETMAEERLSTI